MAGFLPMWSPINTNIGDGSNLWGTALSNKAKAVDMLNEAVNTIRTNQQNSANAALLQTYQKALADGASPEEARASAAAVANPFVTADTLSNMFQNSRYDMYSNIQKAQEDRTAKDWQGQNEAANINQLLQQHYLKRDQQGFNQALDDSSSLSDIAKKYFKAPDLTTALLSDDNTRASIEGTRASTAQTRAQTAKLLQETNYKDAFDKMMARIYHEGIPDIADENQKSQEIERIISETPDGAFLTMRYGNDVLKNAYAHSRLIKEKANTALRSDKVESIVKDKANSYTQDQIATIRNEGDYDSQVALAKRDLITKNNNHEFGNILSNEELDKKAKLEVAKNQTADYISKKAETMFADSVMEPYAPKFKQAIEELKQSNSIEDFNKNMQKIQSLYEQAQKMQNLYKQTQVSTAASMVPGLSIASIFYDKLKSAFNNKENPFNISLSNSGLVSNSKEFNAMNEAKKQVIASKLNSTQPIKNLFDATAVLVAKDNNGNNLLDTSKIQSLDTKAVTNYIRNMNQQSETQTRNLQRLKTLSSFKQVIGDQNIAQPEAFIKYFESNPNKPNILKNLGYEDNADGRQKLRNNISQALTYLRDKGLSEDAIAATILDTMDNADGDIKNNWLDNVSEWNLTDRAKDFQEALPSLYALQFYKQNMGITEDVLNNVIKYQNAKSSDRPRDAQRALDALLRSLADLNRYSSVQQ